MVEDNSRVISNDEISSILFKEVPPLESSYVNEDRVEYI